MRVEAILVAVQRHGHEAEFEHRPSLEVAAAMSFVNASPNGSAARDEHGPVTRDGFDDLAAEVLSGNRVFHIDALVHTNSEFTACWNGQVVRRGLPAFAAPACPGVPLGGSGAAPGPG